MCDYGYTQNCGILPTPAVFYAYPSLQRITDSNSLQSLCENDRPQLVCKPPGKVGGLPVVRKEPFTGYPKKWAPTKVPKVPPREIVSPNIIKPKLLDPDTAILQNLVSGPGWTSRFCLKRIHNLLVREETATKLETRIWALWTHYEKIAKDVFIYDNVDIVANIILVLSTSFLRLPYAQNLFDKLMQRLQRGIYMDSTLKDTVDIKRLAYFFTVLSLCIVEGHPMAQASISSILGVWLESIVDKRQQQFQKSTPTNAVNQRCPLQLMKRSNQLTVIVPDGVLISSLEKSLLPRIICKYFSDGSHTVGSISILSLLKSCCDTSIVVRNRLLHLPVLDPILLKLAITDPSNRILITTSDFMHSYFGINSELYRNDLTEKANVSSGIAPMLEKDSFQILLTRFIHQLSHCASKSLLSTRNDTAFLVCIIGERVPASGEYYEGFGLLLASIVSSAIVGIKGLDMAYLIDSTPEDLELLQYLIYMIKCIVCAGCGEEIIQEYNTGAVLLTMILGPCRLTTTPNGGTVCIGGEGEKGNDLENAAWTTIQAIAKHCPLSLLTPHGVPSLLTFLKAYGEVGEGDQRILAMCMHTIRVLLTSPEEDSCVSDEVMGYFIQRDGMAIFLSVLKQLILQNFDALQEKVVSSILLCCSALNDYEYSQKQEFMRLEGVSILTRLIKHLICHSADKRHMNPVQHLCNIMGRLNIYIYNIQMALADCIGCCVAYYPQALEIFLAMEGLFRLLDLLEISAGPAAPVHLINCIIQLCNYPRCVDQLLYWHRPMKSASQRVVFGQELNDLGKSSWECAVNDEGLKSGDLLQELRPRSDKTLSSMLCSLWREEEDRFEVLRDPEGCIASITHPLMSKFAITYDIVNEGRVSRSCLDMSLSLRPKIFLLIKRIVEITKTEAILFDGLSLNNQVIMQIILNFADLKKSEIYLEMVTDMARGESYSLAPADNDYVLKLSEISRNTLATVLETQRYMIRRFHEKGWPCQTRYLVSEPKVNREDSTLDDYDDNDDVNFLHVEDHDDDQDEELLSGPSASTIASNPNIVPSTGIITSFALTETITPEPLEGGFYQVSPHRLREALKSLLSYQRKHEGWLSLVEQDEENCWKVRTKWKKDWYPLNHGEQEINAYCHIP